MIVRPGLRVLACLAASNACLLLAGAAGAQDDEQEDEFENVLEEVVVTGTRINRRDFSSPSPLVTVSRENLEFSGQPTLEDYLNQMPQMAPVSGRSLNNGGDGTTALDLRAMGPGRTLVVLNGRRVAPSGTGSAIDANNIPSVLVERVEIITGGASTVYGSDAIAGVINFITRTDFEGLSFEGNYNVTAEGDSTIWDANAVFGHQFDNGFNITAYAGRYERESLFAGERAITSVPLIDDWDTGTVVEGGSPLIPGGVVGNPLTDLGNGPVNVTWNPDGTPRAFVQPDDLYNFQPVNYLQTPLSRDTLGLYGHWPLSDRFAAYFELSYAHNQAQITLAEGSFRGRVAVNIDNPLLTPETRALFSRPEFSQGTSIARPALTRRLSELGARIVDYDRKYQRYLTGIRGVLNDTWSLDAWFTYTDADENQRNFNDASRSRILQGLLVDPLTGQCTDPSRGCVPVDLFGAGRLSPEAVGFIRVNDVQNTTQRKQSLASLVASGAPFEIWSGPVDLAFGAEWRRDEAHYQADEVLFTGDSVGFNGSSPIDGTESVFELYSEAILTLYKDLYSGRQLDLEVGYRWSDYDNAGRVNTWKTGLSFQATEAIRFRTMYQHAVRAPNNQELFEAQFTSFGSFVGNDSSFDPCSASNDPAGSGNLEKCMLQGLSASQVGVFEAEPFYPAEFVSGGNPDLVPEASDTFTLGMVINPAALPDLTVSIDYWDLEVTDTIGAIDPGLICFDPLNTSGLFCQNLQRDDTGNISDVISLTENRGLLATDGIDFQVQYLYDLPSALALSDYAQLQLNVTLSHVFSLENQENPVTEVLECSGYFGAPCQVTAGASHPENRMLAVFGYQSGFFSGQLSWRWIEGMDNGAPLYSYVFGYDDPNLAIPEVGAWNYLDLGMGYSWDERVDLRFGINNLLDKEPPLMADAVFANNTDTLMYDVFGRTYFLNLRVQATGD